MSFSASILSIWDPTRCSRRGGRYGRAPCGRVRVLKRESPRGSARARGLHDGCDFGFLWPWWAPAAVWPVGVMVAVCDCPSVVTLRALVVTACQESGYLGLGEGFKVGRVAATAAGHVQHVRPEGDALNAGLGGHVYPPCELSFSEKSRGSFALIAAGAIARRCWR